MMERIAEASPCLKARIAGVLFLLLLLAAACTEFFFHGRLSFARDDNPALRLLSSSCFSTAALACSRSGKRRMDLVLLRLLLELGCCLMTGGLRATDQ